MNIAMEGISKSESGNGSFILDAYDAATEKLHSHAQEMAFNAKSSNRMVKLDDDLFRPTAPWRVPKAIADTGIAIKRSSP
jgi:hypothetical protein